MVEAKDASDALAQLDGEGVDLMLTDVVMPGKSGVELANEVRKLKPGLPIVIMTGYSDQLVENAAEFPFIAKPFTFPELEEVMATPATPA